MKTFIVEHAHTTEESVSVVINELMRKIKDSMEMQDLNPGAPFGTMGTRITIDITLHAIPGTDHPDTIGVATLKNQPAPLEET